jgi:hypothetical protein
VRCRVLAVVSRVSMSLGVCKERERQKRVLLTTKWSWVEDSDRRALENDRKWRRDGGGSGEGRAA